MRRRNRPLSPPDTQDAPKGAFCVSGGESGVAEAARVRRIRLERIRTAEWLALGRLRTRVRCMDAPHNPTRGIGRSRRCLRGVLRIWRREWAGRRCAGSTDSPGANPDSRMAGPRPLAGEGEVHGCTSQSHSGNPKIKTPREGRFRLERIQTAKWHALERAARKGWPHGCTNNPTQEILSP